jgi:hypothetical protein
MGTGEVLPGQGRGAFLVGEQANTGSALGLLPPPLCAARICADHGLAQGGAQLAGGLLAGGWQHRVLNRPRRIVVERAGRLGDQFGAGQVDHPGVEGAERAGQPPSQRDGNFCPHSRSEPRHDQGQGHLVRRVIRYSRRPAGGPCGY